MTSPGKPWLDRASVELYVNFGRKEKSRKEKSRCIFSGIRINVFHLTSDTF